MAVIVVLSNLFLLAILLGPSDRAGAYSRYGYHPSEEIYDNYMRDRVDPWTRDAMAMVNDRRRIGEWTTSLPPLYDRDDRYGPGFYTDRGYDYSLSDRLWPSRHRPATRPYTPQPQSSSLRPFTGGKPPASLEFTMFSDERRDQHTATTANEGFEMVYTTTTKKPKVFHFADNPVFASLQANTTVTTSTTTERPHPRPPKAGIFSDHSLTLNGHQSQSLSPLSSSGQNPSTSNKFFSSTQNPSDGQFPIYFSNPVTGIVYAIAEVGGGQMPANVTAGNGVNNGSIPIFITKEQYDRDMYLLRRHYESQCQRNRTMNGLRPESSSISGAPASSTNFSHIFRLQNLNNAPSATSRPTPSAHRPQTTGASPTKRTTTKSTTTKRKKKKKTKRPQKRPTLTTVTSTTTTARPNVPYVVLGTRLSSTVDPFQGVQTYSTQLEKPSAHQGTMFNAMFPIPIAATSGYMSPMSKTSVDLMQRNFGTTNFYGSLTPLTTMSTTKTTTSTTIRPLTTETEGGTNRPYNPYPNHRIRRSVAAINASEALVPKVNETAIPDSRPVSLLKVVDHLEAGFKGPHENKDLRHSHRLPTKRTKILKASGGNETQIKAVLRGSLHINKTQHSLPREANIITAVNATLTTTTPFPRVVFLGHNSTAKSFASTDQGPSPSPTPRKAGAIATEKREKADKKKKKKEKRKRKKEHGGAGDGLGLLDFLDDDDSDDSDDDDEDDIAAGGSKLKSQKRDEYYDDDDYFYYEEARPKPPKIAIMRPVAVEESPENHSNDSEDDLKENLSQDNASSAAEDADFGALEQYEPPPTRRHEGIVGVGEEEEEEEEEDDDNESPVYATTYTRVKKIYSKKRIRRRPPMISAASGYEDEDDDSDSEFGVGGFFRALFYPVQAAMSRIYDTLSRDTSEESEEVQIPTYTLYNNNALKSGSGEDYDDEKSSSFGDWFGSWFGFNRRNKKIASSTTITPPDGAGATLGQSQSQPVPVTTEAPGWLESWFGFGSGTKATTDAASSEDYDYYDGDGNGDSDKWFFGWFDTKTRVRRRTTTTTSPPMPQVPILTIVDPMKNPQNWIGILAHHIINTTSPTSATITSTTSRNPLMSMLQRVTTPRTTTENPDIPRKVSYEKYQIWRLHPQDDIQLKALEEYKRSEEGGRMQWLKGPTLKGLTDVLVPPKMLIDFQGTLNFEAIDHEVLIFDVGKAIAYEVGKEQEENAFYHRATAKPLKNKLQQQPQRPAKKGSSSFSPPFAMTWQKYYSYDDIIKYLESLRLKHPQLVELIHIGRSYEGRPLVIVKVESREMAAASTASAVNRHKKLKYKRKSDYQANAVLVEAGTHGMEWIGPAAATWMINELLRIMKSNKSDSDYDMIKNTTWYVMPLLNPDGYVFSHEYDRFWRKTRSRHISRPNDLLTSAMTWLGQKKATAKVCYGVDLDRNWSYQWGKRGSSKSPCNENFSGPGPFSEPEGKALSEFLMDYRKQMKLYISMQSYGQIISYPVKANATYNNDRMDDFLDVAMMGMDGLRKNGSKSRYKVDSTHDLIEKRSGSSDAFAAYEAGVPFSYTLQLADNGVHGYLLPSSAIEPTAKDAFRIITGMLNYL